MAGFFTSRPYKEFAGDLGAAIDWFETLGVRYKPTRIGEYERAIEQLISTSSTAIQKKAPEDYWREITALFEAHDLLEIHNVLAGRFDVELRSHIETVAKGPANYIDENPATSSNVGRNIAFELVVMAKLVKAGIPLDFSIKTDVAASFDNRNLLFECKRIQAVGALQTRVKNAYQQLESKYKNPKRIRHRGVIALDITKLINPEFMLYVGQNAQSLDAGVSSLVDRFLQQHERVWQQDRNKKTIAVLLRVSLMGVNQERNEMLTYCQQFALTPINHSGFLNIQTARTLADELKRTAV